jgi:CheY-like chemotaxis protein
MVGRLIRSVPLAAGRRSEENPKMTQIQRNSAVEYGKRELPEKLLCCRSSHGESQSILADRVQPSFAQKRILCVDDNVLELRLRGKILELQGYSVVSLSCPIEALRCDLSTFDLAILDFDMPGMNGRDLLLRMRALHARFPILLLSACASALGSEDCVLFSKCLDKGEPVRHLLDVIAAFLDPNEIPDLGR